MVSVPTPETLPREAVPAPIVTAPLFTKLPTVRLAPLAVTVEAAFQTNTVTAFKTLTRYGGDRTYVTPPEGGTPTMTVTEPIVGSVLGVVVLGEALRPGEAGWLTLAAAVTVMVVATAALARGEAATMGADGAAQRTAG